MRKHTLIAAALAALALASCKGEANMEQETSRAARERAAAAGMERLAKARVFFGHQSVGYNLLDGIAELAAARGAEGPRILEGRDPGAAASPRLLHAAIGRNTEPLGKIGDFEGLVRGGIGDWAEVAFMKLCYVDVGRDTDVQALFAAYKEAMARLAKEYPRVAFMHLTLPLTSEEPSLKERLKERLKALLGRSRPSDNLARERYNRLLRAEYGPSGRLFDLALAEATAPGASPAAHRSGGGLYYSLRPEYTTDGGHLNELGRRRAAEELLAVIASLEAKP
ncbi:MAG TPA: hypothetical protein PLB91_13100 [Spirochaetales bacterium]|nr:hypothetical protein [Spirochaetales bacterium]HRZ64887.1 hypothetical protein [Spirochaetia bacterium]